MMYSIYIFSLMVIVIAASGGALYTWNRQALVGAIPLCILHIMIALWALLDV
jgi:hypothetical protein